MFRSTSQRLAPLRHLPTEPGHYDLYPGFDVGDGLVHAGFETLAERIAGERRIVIDGYVGVLWSRFREGLDAALRARGIQARWTAIDRAMRPSIEIEALAAPFLGGDDPLWGRRFTGTLEDFFDRAALAALRPGDAATTEILYGTGAALAGWDGPLLWLEVPKNEIQFRSRAGSVTNLGVAAAAPPKQMYKRFYFVDWPAVDAHREGVFERVSIVVDEQRPETPVWMESADVRDALWSMSRTAIRARPWFEPGPWGGQWLKRHIPELPQDVPNYAWSFELISPENGVMIRSSGQLFEVPFALLMEHHPRAMLGVHAGYFGREFPIRFDYLDTVDGGNLSVQCHPRPEFIRTHFGESFTQDESYYITDCQPGARVFLGFRDDVDQREFRHALERSESEGAVVDVERWVHTVESRRHALYLIPNGTVHCSGAGNLVLEISATPYIFTFKMYDWLRRDLEGAMRPLNVERAWRNLYFDRRETEIDRAFVARESVLRQGDDWRVVHLSTHRHHFYDVVRYEFDTSIDIEADDVCRVMNLVEGTAIEVATGRTTRFNYAETFVLPAAAGRVTLRNLGSERAMVIAAFVKPLTALSGTSLARHGNDSQQGSGSEPG